MKVLITGGAGFLGNRLAHKLINANSIVVANKKTTIKEVVIFDIKQPDTNFDDKRIRTELGSLQDKENLEQLLSNRFDIIFHLAAIVSGQAEKDFELGMNINLRASMNLIENCRALDYSPMLLFASSCAVFGGTLPSVVQDNTAPTPQSSYGTQKAIVELLINDYNRRGFLDGRVLRLPTIVVRPGKPNAATSSFASGIIREPLNGERAICPVNKKTKIWILSPARVMSHFVHAVSLTKEDLGDNRIVSLPGLTCSVDEIVTGLESVAGKNKSTLIDFKPNEFIQNIVMTWPSKFNTERAIQLGFEKEDRIEEIIERYMFYLKL